MVETNIVEDAYLRMVNKSATGGVFVEVRLEKQKLFISVEAFILLIVCCLSGTMMHTIPRDKVNDLI